MLMLRRLQLAAIFWIPVELFLFAGYYFKAVTFEIFVLSAVLTTAMILAISFLMNEKYFSDEYFKPSKQEKEFQRSPEGTRMRILGVGFALLIIVIFIAGMWLKWSFDLLFWVLAGLAAAFLYYYTKVLKANPKMKEEAKRMEEGRAEWMALGLKIGIAFAILIILALVYAWLSAK